MDNSKEGINKLGISLIEESTKIDNLDKNYDTFNKNDEKEKLIKDIEIDNHANYDTCTNNEKINTQNETYLRIMNSHITKFHILTSIVYILSLISIEFQILQVALMFKLNLLVNKTELITFISLMFFSIATAWLAKQLFISNKQRLTILIAAPIAFTVINFVTTSRSAYILFLCYPFISFCLGLMLFNSNEMFEDYYISKTNDRTRKNLFQSLSMFSSLFVLLIIWSCSKDFFAVWYCVLITQSVVVLSCAGVIAFSQSSPLCLFRDNRDSPSVFYLMEKIDCHPLDWDTKQKLKTEMTNMIDAEDSISYFLFFQDNLSTQISIFITLVFCCAYSYVALVMSVPVVTYVNVPKGTPDHLGYYFKRIAVVFSIACLGGLLGTLLLWLTTFKRKFLISITLALVATLFVLMLVYQDSIYILGGFTLLLINSLYIILGNYAYETFGSSLNVKAARLFQLFYFSSAAVGVILFEVSYLFTVYVAYTTNIVFALVGFILAFLLNK